ncbi:MAG: ferritin-like domain-containing protein [Myxococcales bacterium]|nr:ferritin-like domain-containing protein [Myxococcales bacterium]
MRLRAWRDTWMWLAISACGGTAPAWMRTSPPTKLSVFDAPPLAGATYLATIDPGDFGHPGPSIAIEHGSFKCSQLVALLGMGSSADVKYLAEAQRSCELDVAKFLREPTGFVFVIRGAERRWLTAAEIVRAAAPIDSPAKALLVAWVGGAQLSWGDSGHSYGGPLDGHVRQVAGGYEVAAGARSEVSNCGAANARETVTNYRLTLFVDLRGAVTERARTVTDRYDVADPCHPLGRRPEDFADVTSGGTLRGHLVRAMHHEAESVRAFERIARELRAHGAPEELWRAAERAAVEERDHAERCARLVNERAEIAQDQLPVRSLVELAIDNAREGCIGEAYAALVATVQARTAADATLRAHFAAIAADELAHAALAHAIAEWIDAALSPVQRDRVAEARVAAITELARSLDAPNVEATRALGLPTGDLARRLLAVVSAAGCSSTTA